MYSLGSFCDLDILNPQIGRIPYIYMINSEFGIIEGSLDYLSGSLVNPPKWLGAHPYKTPMG